MREGIRAEIKGLDGRRRVVEQTVAVANDRLTPGVGALPDPANLARAAAPGAPFGRDRERYRVLQPAAESATCVQASSALKASRSGG